MIHAISLPLGSTKICILLLGHSAFYIVSFTFYIVDSYLTLLVSPGVIDLIIASNFLHSNIEIRYPSDMSQLNKLIPCDVHGLEAQPREIRLLAARSSPESSEPSYFAPLCAIQDKVVPTQDECDANTLCLRPSRKTHRMVCKFCLRNYHKLCVGVDIEANVDTCGCYAMVELTERYNNEKYM